jgi:GTPase SAR1 family protein
MEMECKVVVVGDAKVGKTALIHRLTQNIFQEVRVTFLSQRRRPQWSISF